jgi:hypothetical protein
VGCGFCAISIKPEPDLEEEELVVEMPEEVLKYGGASINDEPADYGLN